MTSYSFDEEGVAFYFFIMTLVGFYVIPTTLRLLWPKKALENDKEPVCSTEEAKKKRQRLDLLSKAKSSGKTLRMAILGVAWIVFIWALYSAWQAKINFKPYDPFDVLNIPSGSSEEQARNAFKKLSRLHHPDKAAEDKKEQAEKKFVEISKAYKALTDEKSRKNWEEFGNPDGIRTFSLGVALPSWLVNSGNRIILLALYCIAFGIGLPLIVKMWWTSSKEFSKDGLRHATMSMFFKELRENSSMRKILELLVNSSEFDLDMIKRPSDVQALEKFSKILADYSDPFGDDFEKLKKYTTKGALKAHALLYAHFHRVEVVDANLIQDQVFIINKCSQLVQGIMQISLARQWLLPTLHCMRLSQYLVQGTWEGRSPLLQLPYVTNEIAKHANVGKRSIKSITDLLDMKESDRRHFLQALSNEQYGELIEVAKTFPICNVQSVNVRILGQQQITPSGLITCQVALTLEYPTTADQANKAELDTGKDEIDVDESQVQTFEFDEDGNLMDDPTKKLIGPDALPRPVYCPNFPATKRPNWWIGLMNKNATNIIAMPIKITDLVDKKTITLQLPAPPKPMNVTVRLYLKSDSCTGVDIEKDVSFTVVPQTAGDSPGENWEISGDEDDQAVMFTDEE